MGNEMRSKKGMGISMNYMILIIIGFVALLVMGLIAFRNVKGFSSNAQSCESKQGLCMSQSDCDSKSGSYVGFGCDGDNQVCCLNLCEENGGSCKAACSDNERSAFLYCKGDNDCCIAK